MKKAMEGQYLPSAKFANAHGASHCFTVGDEKIHYMEFPSGVETDRLFVLIHGGHGDWRHFLANVEQLSARGRVIAVDIPGFGLSGPPKTISLEELALPIARLVVAIAASDVTIVGFSFGSLIAAEVCRLVPESITRVCVVSPAGFGGHVQAMADRRRKSADIARRSGLEAGVRHTLTEIMVSDIHLADESPLVASMVEMVRASRIIVRPVSRQVSVVDRLAKSGKPVLVLLGEADPYHAGVIDERRILLTENVPNCDVVVVAKAAHWLMWEQADVFNHAALKFAEAAPAMSQSI